VFAHLDLSVLGMVRRTHLELPANAAKLPRALQELYRYWMYPDPDDQSRPVEAPVAIPLKDVLAAINDELQQGAPVFGSDELPFLEIYIRKLDEVKSGRLAALAGAPGVQFREGWRQWRSCTYVQFAVSTFDFVVYIDCPPSDHPGRIFVFGASIPSIGSGGGLFTIAGSLDEWLSRVVEYDGLDPALTPHQMHRYLPSSVANQMCHRLIELNPHLPDFVQEMQVLLDGQR